MSELMNFIINYDIEGRKKEKKDICSLFNHIINYEYTRDLKILWQI